LKRFNFNIIFLLALVFLQFKIFSQDINYIGKNLYPSIINPNFYEINVIEYSGNNQISADYLNEIISSKATESNLPYQFFASYYREFEKNPSMIRFLQKEFRKGLIKLRDNVPFFDKLTVQGDLISIKNYYEINGFHFSEIKFDFFPNKLKSENILKFTINEGYRAKIDSLFYLGLENIDTEVIKRISISRKIHNGANFNEVLILNEIKNINNNLRNKGYYFSTFNKPRVEIDTTTKTDRVYVEFTPGKRYRIGRIDFIDSSNKQPLISLQMKQKQLEINTGEYVNPQKIEASKDNLLSLGTFELVAIDTSSQFAAHSDTSLNFVAYLLYRKERELNFGISLNQTRMDNFVNLGFETSYRHRNAFGAAQEFTPLANIYLKDLGTILSNQTYELEAQIGFKYAQPLLWKVQNSRVSFITSFFYSYKLLNNYFIISSYNLPVSFPIKFPKITYFNRASIDFNFLRDNPINYYEAYERANKSAKNETDSNNVYQAFYLYGDLAKYIRNEKEFRILTSNTIGISLTGDNRNNPFSPTSGYFTFIGIDGWNPLFFPASVSGLARYLRFQFNHIQFMKLSPTTVLALKGKFGTINLLQDSNTYVPLDRQFFCGGPNSVRAWPSRQLRYSKFTTDNIHDGPTYKFLENFVGNGVLIEGSFEFRFGIAKFPGLNKTIQDALQDFKTTLFLDFGNAFHWYVHGEDVEVSLTDYFTKLAVGTGIGLRYETPIGPLRVDFAFPVYDPLKFRKPFSTMQFNFGIGHAF
jgi:outer membrane protein assembly factor BamA